MINIETIIVQVDNWKADMLELLGFDETLSTQEPLPVDMQDDYVSFDMWLIERNHNPYTTPYMAILDILSELKALYEARGYTADYKIEPATDDTYIAVFTYM